MSDIEKVMWWALGALLTVCAVKFLGPVVIDSLDASCATWRYVAILLGGGVLLGTGGFLVRCCCQGGLHVWHRRSEPCWRTRCELELLHYTVGKPFIALL